jgi:hypothetical protein
MIDDEEKKKRKRTYNCVGYDKRTCKSEKRHVESRAESEFFCLFREDIRLKVPHSQLCIESEKEKRPFCDLADDFSYVTYAHLFRGDGINRYAQ